MGFDQKIGPMFFKTKKALAEHCRALHRKYRPGTPVDGTKPQRFVGETPFDGEDDEFLRALILRHPIVSKKAKVGIDRFAAVVNPTYGDQDNVCFWVYFSDGSGSALGYHECVTPSSQEELIEKALREEVSLRISDFYVRYFAAARASGVTPKCPVSGESLWKVKSVVDHVEPVTFKSLIGRFMESRRLSPDSIRFEEIGAGKIRLQDRAIAEDWVEFHETESDGHLRVMSADAHLKLKRGRDMSDESPKPPTKTPPTKLQVAEGILAWLACAKVGIKLNKQGQPTLRFPDPPDPDIDVQEVISEIKPYREEIIELLKRDTPVVVAATLPWRPYVAKWDLARRKAWGELANDLEANQGLSWDEAERVAFETISKSFKEPTGRK